MAGSKLTNLFKAEIYKYLGIPYYRNNPKTHSSPLAAFVGKGTSQEIALATIATAQKQKIDLLKMDDKKIYNFQKKNGIGIDCSGLAYHLLNFLYQHQTGNSLDDVLIGTENKKGVRRLSADLLTSPPNAIPVADINEIKTGDLLRLDGGTHVIVIIDKTGSKIHYVHSSQKTKIHGVHLGMITITDPDLPLNQQIWTDQTLTGEPYNKYFNPQNGDGIFRLNCLSS